MRAEDRLEIYTDGSSKQHPRRGGYGFRFVYPSGDGEEKVEDFGSVSYLGATNNQMELKACVAALHELRDRSDLWRLEKVAIYTDSIYVARLYNVAKFDWPRRQWYTRSGSPVENVDLWRQLFYEVKALTMKVEPVWVKGHAKNKHNEAVNTIAKKSADSPVKDRTYETQVRRKLTPNSLKIGSVERKGQRLKIRIVQAKWLRQQRVYKYRYEVLSTQSKYYLRVDLGYSECCLRAGHTYLVSFTEREQHPFISKVLKEILEPDSVIPDPA